MPARTPELDGDAKRRMIDAATSLFAAKGVERASLRELTSAAQVNLAAVNYHFGSKEALTETVFGELSSRVNGRRVADLDALLADARRRGRPPSLEAVVSIFVEPYLPASPPAGRDEGRLLAQLILMHRVAPTPMTSRMIREHFDPMARRFVAAFAQACPGVPAAEFSWRYSFMVSTVVLTVTDRAEGNRVARLSDGAADAADTASLRAALVRFVAGGLRAPA